MNGLDVDPFVEVLLSGPYDAAADMNEDGVVNGLDEGVMVELGLAAAWSKPIFLFCDDVRKKSNWQEYPLNLMLFTGIPQQGWRDYYYQSVADILLPHKAYMQWANTQ